MNHIFSVVILSFVATSAFAKLNVVATGTDIGAILQEVGAEDISLEIIAKGMQNLHALETKPSYMVKLNRADLVVSNGLGLEIGWLPSIVRGARNPKINPGSAGSLELGPLLNPIEVPVGSVSRAEGDVHPDGNPHWSLDPIRVGQAAELVAKSLSQLDSTKSKQFAERAQKMKTRLAEKVPRWQERMRASGILKVITYHKTLNYFLERFGVQSSGYLEPKPGIPPSAQHILELISKIKSEKIRLILVEHFYDVKIAERISKEVSSAKVKSVGVAVDSIPGTDTPDALFEQLVSAFEGNK